MCRNVEKFLSYVFYQSINQPTNQPINQPINQSISQSFICLQKQ